MTERYIGKDTPRVDAVEKVTGKAIFVADIKLPGMLYARLVKSPYSHARITGINMEKASHLPGVRAILTGREIPYLFGIYLQDKGMLATEKVRYVGEAVVAIAADTEEIAQEACELVDVEYERLPSTLDPRDSIKERAPLVHERLKEYNHAPGFFPVPDTNVASHFKLRKGDTAKGFQEADVIIENEFFQPMVQNVQMEQHVSIAQWLPSGQIEIWTSAQSPFAVREIFSRGTGIPMNKIRVQVPYVGGGFGGKAGLHWEPLAAFLSKKAGGKPVKLMMTREEEFNTSAVRQGLIARIKTGIRSDGKITAEEILFMWDAGAYADYGVNIGRAAGYSCTGPYNVPNVRCDSLTIYTNHPYGTAYRGFGHAESHWVIERQMDLAASAIKMDPVEFRLKNAALPGTVTPTGEVLGEDCGRVDECIRAVAGELRRNEGVQTGRVRRGRGIAALWKAPAMPSYASSSAFLKFNEDGTVNLVVGEVELGQGSSTVLAQMVAEELQIPVEKIRVTTQDTDYSPYSWQTVASRGAFMDGNAVLRAVESAKKQLRETASALLGVPEDDLTFENETIVSKTQHKGIPLAKITTCGVLPDGSGIGGPVLGYGYYTAEGLTSLDPETGQGSPALMWTFGAQGAEVEVDTLTGEVRVLKIVTAIDAGRVLNRAEAEGQVYGGVLQGLGTAMTEAFVFDDSGRLLNNNLTDYKIYRALDIPDEVIPIFIENPERNGPYGARGIGEHPTISVAAAVGNAIYDATGVDFFELPLTRERVWKKLNEVGR